MPRNHNQQPQAPDPSSDPNAHRDPELNPAPDPPSVESTNDDELSERLAYDSQFDSEGTPIADYAQARANVRDSAAQNRSYFRNVVANSRIEGGNNDFLRTTLDIEGPTDKPTAPELTPPLDRKGIEEAFASLLKAGDANVYAKDREHPMHKFHMDQQGTSLEDAVDKVKELLKYDAIGTTTLLTELLEGNGDPENADILKQRKEEVTHKKKEDEASGRHETHSETHKKTASTEAYRLQHLRNSIRRPFRPGKDSLGNPIDPDSHPQGMKGLSKDASAHLLKRRLAYGTVNADTVKALDAANARTATRAMDKAAEKRQKHEDVRMLILEELSALPEFKKHMSRNPNVINPRNIEVDPDDPNVRITPLERNNWEMAEITSATYANMLIVPELTDEDEATWFKHEWRAAKFTAQVTEALDGLPKDNHWYDTLSSMRAEAVRVQNQLAYRKHVAQIAGVSAGRNSFDGRITAEYMSFGLGIRRGNGNNLGEYPDLYPDGSYGKLDSDGNYARLNPDGSAWEQPATQSYNRITDEQIEEVADTGDLRDLHERNFAEWSNDSDNMQLRSNVQRLSDAMSKRMRKIAEDNSDDDALSSANIYGYWADYVNFMPNNITDIPGFNALYPNGSIWTENDNFYGEDGGWIKYPDGSMTHYQYDTKAGEWTKISDYDPKGHRFVRTDS